MKRKQEQNDHIPELENYGEGLWNIATLEYYELLKIIIFKFEAVGQF